MDSRLARKIQSEANDLMRLGKQADKLRLMEEDDVEELYDISQDLIASIQALEEVVTALRKEARKNER